MEVVLGFGFMVLGAILGLGFRGYVMVEGLGLMA